MTAQADGSPLLDQPVAPPVGPAPLADLGDGRLVHGHADVGYGPVVDAFIANFALRGDLGAGCAVYRDGRPVVEVWGGIADAGTGRPWKRDTAAVIFSCSKGLLAVMAHRLVEEGRLDLDVPIATYWPSFARNGKEAITLRQVLCHRAGLATLDTDLTRDQVLARAPVIDAIEEQRPASSPEAGHAYHSLTFGWLVGEVIRRITGRLPGDHFAATVAGPLGLDTWLGLPADRRDRVARMEPPLPDDDTVEAEHHAASFGPGSAATRSLTMGRAFDFPVEDGAVTFNAPDIQAADIAAANGISTAPSLALLWASCLAGPDGQGLLGRSTVDDAIRVLSEGRQLTGVPDDGARWGTGFQLSSAPSQPLLGPTSFGHAGAGGQLGFADAANGIGFAYLSNQMGGFGDGRSRELTVALGRCLGR